eukprot:jgi/Tetstr1/441224/TSEL_029480.t1
MEAQSRSINAPEDCWLDKEGKVHRRHTADARILQRDLDDVFQIYDLLAPAEEPMRDFVEDGTDLFASSPASSAELFKTITAALALCTTVALRINKRGKKLHVEHEYGAEVAKEFDAVDPLGEKGSADYKELKKAIEKVKAKKPSSSSSSRAEPSSSSREPESFHRGSDNGREGGRREEKSPTGASAAANADIPLTTWGQHGGWKSTSTQLCYMGLHEEHGLSVSRAILSLAEEDELDDSDAGLDLIVTDGASTMDSKPAISVQSKASRPNMFDLSELSGRPTTWEMKEAFYSLEEWASETVITSGGLSKYNPTPGYVPSGDVYKGLPRVQLLVKSELHDETEYGEKKDPATGAFYGGPFWIEEKCGIIPGLQRLMYAGKRMNDDQRTLAQCAPLPPPHTCMISCCQ